MTLLSFLLGVRARAFFHKSAAHLVFLFFRGTRKDARRQVARRKEKDKRGGAILRVWSCQSPRSTRLAEVSRCVWYATVSYVAPRRLMPTKPAISEKKARELLLYAHVGKRNTERLFCELHAREPPRERIWKSSWISYTRFPLFIFFFYCHSQNV